MSFQSSKNALDRVLSAEGRIPDGELLDLLSQITDSRHAGIVIRELPQLRGFSGLTTFRVERDRLRALAGKTGGVLAFIGFTEGANMENGQVSEALAEATREALDQFHLPGKHDQDKHAGDDGGERENRAKRLRAMIAKRNVVKVPKGRIVRSDPDGNPLEIEKPSGIKMYLAFVGGKFRWVTIPAD